MPALKSTLCLVSPIASLRAAAAAVFGWNTLSIVGVCLLAKLNSPKKTSLDLALVMGFSESV